MKREPNIKELHYIIGIFARIDDPAVSDRDRENLHYRLMGFLEGSGLSSTYTIQDDIAELLKYHTGRDLKGFLVDTIESSEIQQSEIEP